MDKDERPIIDYICKKCGGTFKAPQGSRKELCPECLFNALSKDNKE